MIIGSETENSIKVTFRTRSAAKEAYNCLTMVLSEYSGVPSASAGFIMEAMSSIAEAIDAFDKIEHEKTLAKSPSSLLAEV